jgi:hypothetical protein
MEWIVQLTYKRHGQIIVDLNLLTKDFLKKSFVNETMNGTLTV